MYIQRVVRADAIEEGDMVGQLGTPDKHGNMTTLVPITSSLLEGEEHVALRAAQDSVLPATEVVGSAPQEVVLTVDGTEHTVSPSDLLVVWRG